MANSIAVINAGSSSIKFAIHAATSAADRSLGGQIEGIGLSPRLEIRDAQGNIIKTDAWPAPGFDHQAAAREGSSLSQVVESILDRYLRHGLPGEDQPAPGPPPAAGPSRRRTRIIRQASGASTGVSASKSP